MKIVCAKVLIFFGLCKPVRAAGGVVVDGEGRALMIHRNGRWDLPKGHIEAGECPEQAALREVFEETGVRAEIVKFLRATRHTYLLRGTRELKTTRWFEMRALSTATTPQKEEGIDRAEWLTPREIDALLPGSYRTIRRVFRAMR